MKYIVANWKAHFSYEQTLAWIHDFSSQPLDEVAGKVEFIICTPFPFITLVRDMIHHPSVTFGAQNVSHFSEGAYTGEVVATHLQGLVDYVILGHSERRTHCDESDDIISQKIAHAQSVSIQPILCVRGTEDAVVDTVPFIAYEPVGAIGTGKNASAEEVIAMKNELNLLNNQKFLYGGSVNADNVHEYLVHDEIDGVILGKASLHPQELFSIGLKT